MYIGSDFDLSIRHFSATLSGSSTEFDHDENSIQAQDKCWIGNELTYAQEVEKAERALGGGGKELKFFHVATILVSHKITQKRTRLECLIWQNSNEIIAGREFFWSSHLFWLIKSIAAICETDLSEFHTYFFDDIISVDSLICDYRSPSDQQPAMRINFFHFRLSADFSYIFEPHEQFDWSSNNIAQLQFSLADDDWWCFCSHVISPKFFW